MIVDLVFILNAKGTKVGVKIITTAHLSRSVNLIGQERSSDCIDLHFIFP